VFTYGLFSTRWTVGVRFPAEAKYFSTPLRPDRFRGPRSLLSDGYRGLFPWEYSGRGVKLTTQLHLVPRSRTVELDLYFQSPTHLHGIAPHERLLKKIAASGVASRAVAWIRELLFGRTQIVRVGGQLSEKVRVTLKYHKEVY
jgi:hypothetical protein